MTNNISDSAASGCGCPACIEERNEKPIVVVCGWCPDARERTRAAAEAGNTVSHSMCPACTKKMEDLAATKYSKETK